MYTEAPPPAPNPVTTINAQTGSNLATATGTQQLNMVDQYTPYGSQTYSQVGNWGGTTGTAAPSPTTTAPTTPQGVIAARNAAITGGLSGGTTGATGGTTGLPHYAMTSTLSPQEQAKQDQQWEFDRLTNQLGINQTKKLTGLLDTPFKLGNEETESRLMELGRKRLDPMIEQRRAGLESRLYNQGVMPGTEAYTRAMQENGQTDNDAYNQLLLTGRGAANTELMAERNQPINEITALMSGGQVNQPNFGNTPQTQIAPTDVAGITQQGYNNSLLPWQQQNQQNQALMGGLFGLGGAALGGWGRSTGFGFR